MSKKCKYFVDDVCDNCTDEWIKCDICKKTLDWVGEDMEINAYILYESSVACQDREDYDRVLTICPECFEQIKGDKNDK